MLSFEGETSGGIDAADAAAEILAQLFCITLFLNKLAWQLGQAQKVENQKKWRTGISDAIIKITVGETLTVSFCPFLRVGDVKCKVNGELGNLCLSCGSTTNWLYSWQVTSPSGSHFL